MDTDLHNTVTMWAYKGSDGKFYVFSYHNWICVLFLVFWDKVSFYSSHWLGTHDVPRLTFTSQRSCCFCLLSTGIKHRNQPTNQQMLWGERPAGKLLPVQLRAPDARLLQHPSKSQIRHLEFVSPVLERWGQVDPRSLLTSQPSQISASVGTSWLLLGYEKVPGE